MNFPENLLYSQEHMWTQEQADGSWLAGITDYAQDLLGDIVFVDPPKVGSLLQAKQPCGLVESVKTGSDLHAPLDGKVLEINALLSNSPEALNNAPYQHWIFRFEASDKSQTQQLCSAKDYQKLISD
ncbi:MAG: glycine cleavage system protein GcvH [Methylophilus sp.]|nr:glycine cleavage system protein GcvH [Methylophilus sp.]